MEMSGVMKESAMGGANSGLLDERKIHPSSGSSFGNQELATSELSGASNIASGEGFSSGTYSQGFSRGAEICLAEARA
jgi:hypothetical protein